MKKLLSFLCLLLTAALLLPAASVAAQTEEDGADVYAVVTLSDGGELVVDEAPGADLMDDAESYVLYVAQEQALSVNRLQSGVDDPIAVPLSYSVDFTVPGTEIEVFLTGLKADNVAEVQQAIVGSIAGGKSFDLTDLGFIDAEKCVGDTEDDDLCWAAALSNILRYTGWAAQAGYTDSDEDDIFELFIDSFTDKGGAAVFGLAWFFNGAQLASTDPKYDGYAQIKDYPDTGGCLTDYAFDRLVAYDKQATADKMDDIALLLRSGWGVSLGLDIYVSGQKSGGHAVTMWGYALDRSADSAPYKYIFLTDSDSDKNADARREAPDVMNVYTLSELDNGYYSFQYNPVIKAVISDYTALAPYSADLEKETDPDASKSKVNNPDLVCNAVYLGDSADPREVQTLFESGTDIHYAVHGANYGDVKYEGWSYLAATVTDADQQVVFSDSSLYVFNLKTYYTFTTGDTAISNLPAGDYTLNLVINPDHSKKNVVKEAYYYNNSMSVSFQVRDSYLLGDYDGDGTVTVLDATFAQRRLVLYDDGLDYGLAAIRGDVNGGGMSILDVTLIQRYLAGFTFNNSVGEKRLYESVNG